MSIESKPPSLQHPRILQTIAGFLPSNDVTCTLRLLNKAAAALFRQRTVIHLSQPSPGDAFRRHWTAPGRMRSMSFRWRRKFLKLTAASGSLANLETALQVAGIALSALSGVLGAAAAAGHLGICAWLRKRGCAWGPALSKAARTGRRRVCEWLLQQGCPWHVDAAREAATGGHMYLMLWLWQQRPQPGSESELEIVLILHSAAQVCELGALKRLAEEISRTETGRQRLRTILRYPTAPPAAEEPRLLPPVRYRRPGAVPSPPLALEPSPGKSINSTSRASSSSRTSSVPDAASIHRVPAARNQHQQHRASGILGFGRPGGHGRGGGGGLLPAVPDSARDAGASSPVGRATPPPPRAAVGPRRPPAVAPPGGLPQLSGQRNRSSSNTTTTTTTTADVARRRFGTSTAKLQVAALARPRAAPRSQPTPAASTTSAAASTTSTAASTTSTAASTTSAAASTTSAAASSASAAASSASTRLQPTDGYDSSSGSSSGSSSDGPGFNPAHVLVAAAAASSTHDWQAKVEWLEAHTLECEFLPLQSTFIEATKRPDALDRITWLLARGYRVAELAAYGAGFTGSVALLRALQDDVGADLGVCAASGAAEAGNLAALQYLLDRGVAVCSYSTRTAFEHGHLAALQLLHTRGIPIVPFEIEYVVDYTEGRKLAPEVVRWTLEVLGVETLASSAGLRDVAAAVGDVETLAWLRELGCGCGWSWGSATFGAAMRSGCEETMEWLAENGCPLDCRVYDFREAACRGDLSTLRLCWGRLGCSCDKRELLLDCLKDSDCDPPVLDWLVREWGCPVDWPEAARMARCRRPESREEALRWLDEQQLLLKGTSGVAGVGRPKGGCCSQRK